MVTDDRLREIIRDEHPNDVTWFKERAEMARELLALRDRNHRLTVAALNGNSRAVFREFAKTYMPKDTKGESHLP